ncbi:uncharacterized protein LOC142555920 [Primulina tabacum]|uniref:uncharacterized protein LOC142555920 n=1 Tax=Primulina tabacum TaxID=48773 RepID=UPI003F5A4812
MAFYSDYDGHTDDFCSIPCQSSEYNMVPTPFQASFSPSSWYEFNEPKVSEYNYFIIPSVSNYMVYTEPKLMQYSPVENHSSDNEYYSGYVNRSGINYSVYHCTELKPLQYDPSLFSEKKSRISYSISTEELNETEYKEYSPEPYRGGYDPITTYGRPLPPSDEICYPRSTPRPNVVSFDGFDYGSIPSPYRKDDLDNLSTKLPITIEEADQETDDFGNGDEVTGTGEHGEIGEPVQSTPSDNSHKKHDDERYENGRNGDYDDKIGWQTSYGSGLESMDLCESIFGYWPCLDQIERQKRDNFREIRDQESRRDPWQLAADYLFGSPVIYENENYLHLQHHHQEIQHESYKRK